MNIDAMIYAINDLKKIIKQIEEKATIEQEEYAILEKELNSFLVNLSSYVMRNNLKHDSLLSALQYAFNLVKHEKKIIDIKNVKKGGFNFPISFPFSSNCNEIYWTDISKMKLETRYGNQYRNYIKELNCKRIIDTIKVIENMLKI